MTAAPYPAFDGSQRCLGKDELFFAADPGRDPQRTSAARELCDACPFKEPCAAYALTHDVWGIWGGLTREVRQRIQRAHGITPEPLEIGYFVAGRTTA